MSPLILFIFINFTSTLIAAFQSECTIQRLYHGHIEGGLGSHFRELIPLSSLTNSNSSYIVDLHFSVTISENLFILLTPDASKTNYNTDNVYLISLGNNGNTYSRIVRQNFTKQLDSDGLLSGNDIRSFRLVMGNDGWINLTRENDSEQIFAWKDSDPVLNINYFSFGVYNDVSGVIYYNCKLPFLPTYYEKGCGKCSTYDISSATSFKQFLFISDLNELQTIYPVDIHFSAVMGGDFYIILTIDPTEAVPGSLSSYTIHIGSNGNYDSFLMAKGNSYQSDSRELLASGELRSFWIRITENGNITVGTEDGNNVFLSWTDSEPLNVTYITFGAFNSGEGKVYFNCN